MREEARAAQRRAEELGYGMDFFEVNSLGSGKRLSEVLLARGIRGVLVQAFKNSSALELGWDRFCTVFVGPENDEIHAHNVQPDYRASVRIAVRECLARGYRRPGFALKDYEASGTSEPIFAQVLAERARLAEQSQPPIFHWRPGNPEDLRAAHRWFRKARPDCLVASHAGIYFWLTNPGFYGLKKLEPVRIPENLPMVSLREERTLPWLAFTSLRELEQGIEAVNLLHRLLQQGVIGVPPVPMRMLLPPLFVAGASLPHAGRRPAENARVDEAPDTT